MSVEIVAGENFIYGLLGPAMTAAGVTYTHSSGVTRPRLFSGKAEAGVPEPYAIVQNMSPGVDQRVLNGDLVWAPLEFIVKAVKRTRSWDDLTALAALIDATLHHTSGTNGTHTIESCTRLRGYLFEEDQEALTYRYLGSRFVLLTN